MTPLPGARPALAVRTPNHALVLGLSLLLHAGLLTMVMRRAPVPPVPETPVLEMAFEAAPVPPPAVAEPEPAAEGPAAAVVPDAPAPEAPPVAAGPVPIQVRPDALRPPVARPKVVPKPRVLRAASVAPTAAPAPQSMPEAAPPPTLPIAAPPAAPSGAWQGSVGTWLRSHKTYPDAARRDAEQGRVTVRFTVQRDGTVVAVTLLHGSGSAALDEAAQALLRGAHLPPFPTDMKQAEQSVSLGISYTLEP